MKIKPEYCLSCGGYKSKKISHVCKGIKPIEWKIVPLKAKTICNKCKKTGCSLVSWQDGKCCFCNKNEFGHCCWCTKLKEEKGLEKWIK